MRSIAETPPAAKYLSVGAPAGNVPQPAGGGAPDEAPARSQQSRVIRPKGALPGVNAGEDGRARSSRSGMVTGQATAAPCGRDDVPVVSCRAPVRAAQNAWENPTCAAAARDESVAAVDPNRAGRRTIARTGGCVAAFLGC